MGKAAAQTRSVRLVVPFGPGSTTDLVARFTADLLAVGLGVSVSVDNRTGAGGLVGAEVAARARPDGSVLCLGTIASHAIAPSMVERPPFSPTEDFAPVSLLVRAPALLAVHPALPVHSIEDLAALGDRLGTLTFTSGGQGTVGHLAGEVLRIRHGLRLQHVPHRDIGLALADVTTGRVDLISYQVAALRPYLDRGLLRPILGLSGSPIASMPSVRSATEVFADPSLDFDAWFGLFLPAGAASELAEHIHGTVAPGFVAPSTELFLREQELLVAGLGPGAFSNFLRGELRRWGEVVRQVAALR